MDNTPDQLVEYARKIAKHQAYPVLENGLQPLDDYKVDGERQYGLWTKLEREQQEFADAVTNKDVWHQYHEAADLLYYAACIAEQIKFNNPHTLQHWTYIKVLRETIAGAGLLPRSAEKAARAKYSWRSEQPGNKNEAYEIELIKMSLDPDFG